MAESGQTNRRLANWIDSFLEYSDVISSPRLFRKWAAISILAGVMEKKVWVRTKGSNLYPNLYVILVGPPGVGKSAVLSQSERMLRAIPELHVAPSSLTTASLIDTLEIANRKIIRPTQTPNFVQFNSLLVVASELGVFLPAYDPPFMNTLTKMYDGELYEERRRTGKKNHVRIDNPQLHIIGGTTPSYLNSFLPDGAWDQGFTSRTIFVYSGEPVRTPLFSDEDEFNHLEHIYINLVHDLKLVAQCFGKMTWDQEAADAIVAWDNAGLPPVPEHGKLAHYNSRRLAHAIKLCMVASASRGSDLRVSLSDYQTALDWLLEAEALIPDIFRSYGVSAEGRVMEDAWYYVFKNYSKNQRPTPHHHLMHFLKDRAPSHTIPKIIDIMVQSHMLKIVTVPTGNGYIPGDKAVKH